MTAPTPTCPVCAAPGLLCAPCLDALDPQTRALIVDLLKALVSR